MRLGLALKAYRQLNDLTATQLAGQMGVSPGVVARLEKGDEIRSRQMAAVLGWLFQADPVVSITRPAPVVNPPAGDA